jgi:hypothetical protein
MKQSPIFFRTCFFISCVFLTGCRGCFNNKLSGLPKPVTTNAFVDIPVSTINIPIFCQIKKFEEWVNKKINGRFLETTFNPSTNSKDEVLLIFSKVEPIKINTAGDRLVCDFPLHITATIIKSRLGKVLTEKFEPMNAVVYVQLITPVGLDAAWNIVTKFRIRDIKWIKEPLLKIGPVKQNLKRKVNTWLKENQTEITKMLDRELNESVSLEPTLSKIWYDLQRPLIIHKNEPKAWMKFTCNNIEGKITVLPDVLVCYTSVKAKMNMMTDTSNQEPPSKLPVFKLLQQETDTSDIYLYALGSFQEINEEVNNQLRGKTFTAKGYTVRIKDIRAYASDAGLSVAVTTGGDIKGMMVASGIPEYEINSQTIHIRNFEYVMNSGNTLVNATEELLHESIKDTIVTKLSLKLDALIKTVPPLVERAITKGKTGKVVDINLNHLYVQGCEMIMDSERIHYKIHAVAEADLKLKELNAGKKLKIKTTMMKEKQVKRKRKD